MTEQKQRRKPRKYTDEFKQQLVELYRSGKRRCDICREYDIATSLFDKWVKQASNSGSFHEKEKLVLSGKAVAREAEAEERNHKISMIVPGTVMEGTVESLMPYGAFINLGNGLSGLVHISQICERRIKKPSEVLKEGQKVKAKVLNTNDNKISLSMKALEEEMVDTAGVAEEELEEYTDTESTGTSLGSLLAGFHFDA
jgi:small subunit ribosomal protein S1